MRLNAQAARLPPAKVEPLFARATVSVQNRTTKRERKTRRLYLRGDDKEAAALAGSVNVENARLLLFQFGPRIRPVSVDDLPGPHTLE